MNSDKATDLYDTFIQPRKEKDDLQYGLIGGGGGSLGIFLIIAVVIFVMCRMVNRTRKHGQNCIK